MAGAIPERRPIGDPFTGSLIRVGDFELLSTNMETTTNVIMVGEFMIRYGIRFLGKLHLSIVPGLVVLDYGEILTGEEAWEFLHKQSNRYPRSEVVGYRNDGTDDMALIRSLDMAVPPEVLVYESPDASRPIAQPTALITGHSLNLPDRLKAHLPTYETLAQWQAETTS